MILDERDYNEEPKPRGKSADPKSRYDYCKIMASITGKPVGAFLKWTASWPDSWFIDVQSNCREKTKDQQAKFIWWFLKEGRPKEIN